jgi:hypothetical protein
MSRCDFVSNRLTDFGLEARLLLPLSNIVNKQVCFSRGMWRTLPFIEVS